MPRSCGRASPTSVVRTSSPDPLEIAGASRHRALAVREAFIRADHARIGSIEVRFDLVQGRTVPVDDLVPVDREMIEHPLHSRPVEQIGAASGGRSQSNEPRLERDGRLNVGVAEPAAQPVVGKFAAKPCKLLTEIGRNVGVILEQQDVLGAVGVGPFHQVHMGPAAGVVAPVRRRPRLREQNVRLGNPLVQFEQGEVGSAIDLRPSAHKLAVPVWSGGQSKDVDVGVGEHCESVA